MICVEHMISMGHRLPSYDGICSSMHGHNVRVVVELDPGDRFVDFKVVGDRLRTLLEPLDHAMVLYVGDPIIEVVSKIGGQRVVLLSHEPTTENIAEYVFREMNVFFAVRVVTVHETAKYAAKCFSSYIAQLNTSPVYRVK